MTIGDHEICPAGKCGPRDVTSPLSHQMHPSPWEEADGGGRVGQSSPRISRIVKVLILWPYAEGWERREVPFCRTGILEQLCTKI